MKSFTISLLTVLQTAILAVDAADVHPGFKNQSTLQYEYLSFSGSMQKEDGNRWTLGLKHAEGVHRFNLAAEKTDTNTYQPPLKDNLDVTKLYFKYENKITQNDTVHAHFITIWDNMVPTDNGNVYGLGNTHGFNPNTSVSLSGYYSDYADFDVYQLDLGVEVRHQIAGIETGVTLMSKSIFVDTCSNAFCSNADRSYFSPGIKIKVQREGHFVHLAALFGKRVFAVLQDGMMVQHHAMEFTDTYMAGIGKRWKRMELKNSLCLSKSNRTADRQRRRDRPK